MGRYDQRQTESARGWRWRWARARAEDEARKQESPGSVLAGYGRAGDRAPLHDVGFVAIVGCAPVSGGGIPSCVVNSLRKNSQSVTSPYA